VPAHTNHPTRTAHTNEPDLTLLAAVG